MFEFKLLIMRGLLLLLLVSGFSFGQNHVVEIRLLNQNIGSPAFNFSTNVQSESNDAGINSILQAHNVFGYQIKGGHLYPPFYNRHIEIWCDNCNASQLNSDLLAYSGVIEKARITNNQSSFDDNLRIQVSNTTLGIPNGISNGIIVTNDPGLNQIFQTFNVYYYLQSFPNATTNSLLRMYDVVCNCNNVQLKAALDNYTAVISFTEYPSVTYLLGNNQFQKSKTTISQNPFSTNFNIQSEEPISNYSLVDISGKQLITTTSKNELDNLSSQLNYGIYFLKLQFENGQSGNFKLIKE